MTRKRRLEPWMYRGQKAPPRKGGSKPLRIGPGLKLVAGSSEDTLTLDLPPEWDVRITEVGTGGDVGKYGWQRIIGSTGGAWVDVPGAGTLTRDPAYEYNASGGVEVGDRVRVIREIGSGETRFQLDRCTGEGGGGGEEDPFPEFTTPPES